jgi:hypothetical protein
VKCCQHSLGFFFAVVALDATILLLLAIALARADAEESSESREAVEVVEAIGCLFVV